MMWQVVHAAKLGAWALLISMSFVLVASVKSLEGRLYHMDHQSRARTCTYTGEPSHLRTKCARTLLGTQAAAGTVDVHDLDSETRPVKNGVRQGDPRLEDGMQERFEVSVYRRLDNRLNGDWSDSSLLAWELHRRRALALHEAFDENPSLEVLDWGDTDDNERTHELVELIVSAVGTATAAVPLTVIVGWIGGVLSSVLSDMAVDAAKGLIARLRRKQDENKIADFTLRVGDRDVVTVFPEDRGGEVRVQTADGRWLTATWTASTTELPSGASTAADG